MWVLSQGTSRTFSTCADEFKVRALMRGHINEGVLFCFGFRLVHWTWFQIPFVLQNHPLCTLSILRGLQDLFTCCISERGKHGRGSKFSAAKVTHVLIFASTNQGAISATLLLSSHRKPTSRPPRPPPPTSAPPAPAPGPAARGWWPPAAP